MNCEVFGQSEASVTWTKDGLNSIPRAQLKDNGKVLVINDVGPADSGIYECKAMNIFGESYTTTTLIVAGTCNILLLLHKYLLLLSTSVEEMVSL